MNSESTFPIAHQRKFSDFLSIEEYPEKSSSGTFTKKINEVLIDYSIPDINKYVLSVRSMQGWHTFDETVFKDQNSSSTSGAVMERGIDLLSVALAPFVVEAIIRPTDIKAIVTVSYNETKLIRVVKQVDFYDEKSITELVKWFKRDMAVARDDASQQPIKLMQALGSRRLESFNSHLYQASKDI